MRIATTKITVPPTALRHVDPADRPVAEGAAREAARITRKMEQAHDRLAQLATERAEQWELARSLGMSENGLAKIAGIHTVQVQKAMRRHFPRVG